MGLVLIFNEANASHYIVLFGIVFVILKCVFCQNFWIFFSHKNGTGLYIMTHLLSYITQVQWNGTIERMGQSKRNPMAQVTEQRQTWAVSIWKWYCPGGQRELLQSGESSRDSRQRLHDHSPVTWYPVSAELEKDSREPTQPHGLWSPWYLLLWMRTMHAGAE